MDTIRNISLLSKLQSAATLLLQQIERLENEGGVVHPVDAGLMRDKTHLLYELLLQLDLTLKTQAPAKQVYAGPPLEIAQKQETMAGNLAETTVGSETPDALHDDHADDYVFQGEETPFDFVVETSDHPRQKDSSQEIAMEENETSADSLWNERFQQPVNPFKEKTKTTLDLFDESPSLADKLVTPDHSVASKIGNSKVNDLRQAIGINDKFILINELFEGNISYYNKAIDELNSFQSLNGAKTYLIELSVIHRWTPDLPAVDKINQIVERKFIG